MNHNKVDHRSRRGIKMFIIFV